MATKTPTRAVTAQLSGTTADTVNFQQRWPAFEITNHDTDSEAAPLYYRMDGTTAVSGADGCGVVLPGRSKVVAAAVNADNLTSISIVGDGNTYTIEGVN